MDEMLSGDQLHEGHTCFTHEGFSHCGVEVAFLVVFLPDKIFLWQIALHFLVIDLTLQSLVLCFPVKGELSYDLGIIRRLASRGEGGAAPILWLSAIRLRHLISPGISQNCSPFLDRGLFWTTPQASAGILHRVEASATVTVLQHGSIATPTSRFYSPLGPPSIFSAHTRMLCSYLCIVYIPPSPWP